MSLRRSGKPESLNWSPEPEALPSPKTFPSEEHRRLDEEARRAVNWKRWGPYLAERQWGTVREDYSADGHAWTYFPHDHARSRAYRWGEDGLLGLTDRECRLCFALALWNGRDPILKERLFGLSNREGNHGEDVKECYYYLDSTPTHSYMKALYKYPQAAFPYERLVEENGRRSREEPEFELTDTGIFDGNRYFDVFVEYAKAGADNILIRITAANRGPEEATLHLLPTLWFRNTWSWGCRHEGCGLTPRIRKVSDTEVRADHPTLGRMGFSIEPIGGAPPVELLFTENETNSERLFQTPNAQPFVKDAFHRYLIDGERGAVNPRSTGSKLAAHFEIVLPPGEERTVRARLRPASKAGDEAFGNGFEETFETRRHEADEFYGVVIPADLSPEETAVTRQAYAGLLWSKQFYQYIVQDWLEGDPEQVAPPPSRWNGRNHDWRHLYSRDVISMPDKWEYPWFATWDLAFHTITFCDIDPAFAKRQLELFLREWYMHPNGQIPAYEYQFDDVNPPVHAWAAWRVYKMTGRRGARDSEFLERIFHKLLMNFTWWVNRKDPRGDHIFSGGFLGLDNIGVFDRSRPLPTGGTLEQADGTAWMAFYCGTMLSIALELARESPVFEDIASKFFEHFVDIADAINHFAGDGLWDEEDGFYYDRIHYDDHSIPLRMRSLVGIIPLFAVEILEQEAIDRLPGFKKRMNWFLENRRDLARTIAYMETFPGPDGHNRRLLAIPSRERLVRMLHYVLDENEFLSPYGIRSLSRAYQEKPYSFRCGANGETYTVEYAPGESPSGLFGGNSNWRGPIWLPPNFILIEALERYHHFYGDTLKVECPTGSGKWMTLAEVAVELSNRLTRLFLPDAKGHRPLHGGVPRHAMDPLWKDYILFYECFHGETGRGVGANHQTGWTSLVARLFRDRRSTTDKDKRRNQKKGTP